MTGDQITEKPCTMCGEVKPLDAFAKNRANKTHGRAARCRECAGAARRKWKRDNRERWNEYQREWRKTDGAQAASKKRVRKYREDHPEKRKAHMAVLTALRNGSLEQRPCEVCGGTRNIEAHHDDYDKPLDIRWLCRVHHTEWHLQRDEMFERENQQ